MVPIATLRRVQEGCVTHRALGCGNHLSAVSFWTVVIKCRFRKEGAGARGWGGGGSEGLMGTECPFGRMDEFLETDGDLGSSA